MIRMTADVKFISFSGIDGAGKSTQIDKLLQYLKENGSWVVYLWARGGYTPGIEYLKKILRRFLGRRLPASGDVAGRTRYFKAGLVRKLWIRIALLDLILVYAVLIRFRLLLGYSVVCDRYLWDTLIDLKILFPQETVERWLLWRILVWSAPEPDVAFLLYVPFTVSQTRSASKGARHVEPEEDLRTRHGLYERLVRSDQFRILDGTWPRGEITSHVLKAVSELRGRTT